MLLCQGWLCLLTFSVPYFTASSIAAELAGFKTEPTFTIEKFDIKNITENESLLAPGYIFIDPLFKQWGYGPQIYTQEGELVWYGNSTAFARVQDFKTCDFRGQRGNHLCWHDAQTRHGHKPIGYKVVFDQTYTQVGQNYSIAGNQSYPNTHEFHMLDGGYSFLQTVYEPRRIDLTPYAGPKKGWVFDGCFQEIATQKGNIIFQWCYLQSKLPVWESKVFIAGHDQKNISSEKVGSGTFDSPWDFIHLNAIDKNSEGDYLVSARYFDQIFKIAGPGNAHGIAPGTVIWRLGGVGNHFKMDFEFSRQHSVRYLQTEKTGDTLAIFDNAWDGFTPATARQSSGKVIRVNNQTGTMNATLVHKLKAPNKTLSKAQGGIQPLANGNFLVGWGVRPQISEFSPTGVLLHHARFRMYSYRAFKSPWVGRPHWKPKLLSYRQSCSPSALHVYASWNGATEVAYWRFHIGPHETGPWSHKTTLPKGQSFETHARLLTRDESKKLSFGFPRYVMVEALDSDFKYLNSTVAATFVPSGYTRLKHKCTVKACNEPLTFGYEAEYSISDTNCGMLKFQTFTAILFFILVTELLDKLSTYLFQRKYSSVWTQDLVGSKSQTERILIS